MEKEILWRLIADIFEVDPKEITENTLFADELWADELDLQELSMALEEEFDLEPVARELTNQLGTLSVGDVLHLIRTKLRGRSGLRAVDAPED